MKLFILDVPILIVLGFVAARVYARYLVDDHPNFYFHAGWMITMIFWINALLCLLGLIEPWGARAMVRPVSGYIAVMYVAAYPLWFVWGARRAFQLFGRNPRQGGFLWPLRDEDKTEPFKPPWNQKAVGE